jgi:hypothetical protein
MSAQPVSAFVLDSSGRPRLREVCEYGLSYHVERQLWWGKFAPRQSRGLIDYLDGQAFVASHLPDRTIPHQRDENWELIEDPDRFAITARGTVVVCNAPVVIGNGAVEDLDVKYLAP